MIVDIYFGNGVIQFKSVNSGLYTSNNSFEVLVEKNCFFAQKRAVNCVQILSQMCIFYLGYLKMHFEEFPSFISAG